MLCVWIRQGECSRWLFECDKRFAKANTLAKQHYNINFEEMNFLKNSAFSSTGPQRVTATCSKDDVTYKTVALIPDYPCKNPLSAGQDDLQKPTDWTMINGHKVEIWNYNHDYSQADAFCKARGKQLLSAGPDTASLWQAIGQFIAGLNKNHNENIQFWLPYKDQDF